MGLGVKSNETVNATYLAIAGGFIWDKSKDESHPQFARQSYNKVDGTTGERAGAQYENLTGMVTNVRFNTHEKYGESILVTVASGDENYIISLGTNNRSSQDMMKVLLKMNFSKQIFINPYDFTDKVKNKRVQGISFIQDGDKIALRNDDAPFKEASFWKTAEPKKIKRFFEDLTEWFVDEVTAKVVNVRFGENAPAPVAQPVAPAVAKVEEPVVEAVQVVEPVKVEKALVESMPEMEDEDDLDDQLGALLGM